MVCAWSAYPTVYFQFFHSIQHDFWQRIHWKRLTANLVYRSSIEFEYALDSDNGVEEKETRYSNG